MLKGVIVVYIQNNSSSMASKGALSEMLLAPCEESDLQKMQEQQAQQQEMEARGISSLSVAARRGSAS